MRLTAALLCRRGDQHPKKSSTLASVTQLLCSRAGIKTRVTLSPAFIPLAIMLSTSPIFVKEAKILNQIKMPFLSALKLLYHNLGKLGTEAEVYQGVLGDKNPQNGELLFGCTFRTKERGQWSCPIFWCGCRGTKEEAFIWGW